MTTSIFSHFIKHIIMEKAAITLIVILLLSLFTNPVEALGATYNSIVFVMSPGEIKDIDLGIENYFGNEDIDVCIDIRGDKEIVNELNKNSTYHIPVKTKNYLIPFRINIPFDTRDSYSFDVIFSDIKNDRNSEVITNIKIYVFENTTDYTFHEKVKQDSTVNSSEKIVSDQITGNFLSGTSSFNLMLFCVILFVCIVPLIRASFRCKHL